MLNPQGLLCLVYPNLSCNEQDICLSIFYDRLPIAIDVSSRTGGWWSLKPRLSHGSTSDFTNTTMWHSKSFVFVFYKHHDLTLKIFCICTLKISRCGHSQTFSISCKNFSCVSELLNQKHFFVWMHSIRWMIFMRNKIFNRVFSREDFLQPLLRPSPPIIPHPRNIIIV